MKKIANKAPKLVLSTYEKEMQNAKFQRLFDKRYNELLLSELLLALMQGENISVRKLAQQIKVAPSVIQSIRSGKHANITLKNFAKILAAFGGKLSVKYGQEEIILKVAA